MVSNSVYRRLLLVFAIILTATVRAEDPVPLDAEALAALGIDQEIPAAPAAAMPAKVQPNDGSWDWSAGPYKYDGAGNIIAIGTQSFTYDVRGRLVGATMTRSDQPGSQQFTYSYDVMGNMVSRTAVTSTPIPTPTSAATNHLTGNGAAYDAAGNLTSIQPPGQPFTYAHTYDALNTLQKTHVTASPGTPRYYVYTADGERLWTFDGATNSSRWTLRDLSGKVLRDFTFDWVGDQPRWRLSRDYVYRDGLLLAAITPTETLHFSLDHLGSVRVVTDANKQRVGLHYYLPFGEEWLVQPQATDTEPMKFTGHERDSDIAGGTTAVDYMHARFYAGRVGRFLSVDPFVDVKNAIKQPQMWNRYAYVLNNPVRFTDPTGKYVCQGNERECKVIDAAISRMRTAAASLKQGSAERVRLEKAIAFFGDKGEKNGVFVRTDLTRLVPASTRPGGLITIVRVNLDVAMFVASSGRNGSVYATEMSAMMAHEGGHGVMQRLTGGSRTAAQNEASEWEAFYTQAAVNEGFGHNSHQGIWTREGGLDENAIQKYVEIANREFCSQPGANCQ